jgi:hypothetical protein
MTPAAMQLQFLESHFYAMSDCLGDLRSMIERAVQHLENGDAAAAHALLSGTLRGLDEGLTPDISEMH